MVWLYLSLYNTQQSWSSNVVLANVSKWFQISAFYV